MSEKYREINNHPAGININLDGVSIMYFVRTEIYMFIPNKLKSLSCVPLLKPWTETKEINFILTTGIFGEMLLAALVEWETNRRITQTSFCKSGVLLFQLH